MAQANTAQKFECGFCRKAFSSERTLSAHMCVKKRRKLDENNIASRLGHRLFQRFHELNTPTRRQKSFDEFIESRYYASFIKFARFLMDLKPVDEPRFIDFVFQNGIKERDWCKDKVYIAYVQDLLAKEPAERGLERSIKTIDGWVKGKNLGLSDFFASVSPAEATHMVKMGKISPWVLYLAKTSDALWVRLSPEQADIISETIDPKIWRVKFELKKDDCTFARQILEEAGI